MVDGIWSCRRLQLYFIGAVGRVITVQIPERCSITSSCSVLIYPKASTLPKRPTVPSSCLRRRQTYISLYYSRILPSPRVQSSQGGAYSVTRDHQNLGSRSIFTLTPHHGRILPHGRCSSPKYLHIHITTHGATITQSFTTTYARTITRWPTFTARDQSIHRTDEEKRHL